MAVYDITHRCQAHVPHVKAKPQTSPWKVQACRFGAGWKFCQMVAVPCAKPNPARMQRHPGCLCGIRCGDRCVCLSLWWWPHVGLAGTQPHLAPLGMWASLRRWPCLCLLLGPAGSWGNRREGVRGWENTWWGTSHPKAARGKDNGSAWAGNFWGTLLVCLGRGSFPGKDKNRVLLWAFSEHCSPGKPVGAAYVVTAISLLGTTLTSKSGVRASGRMGA